MKLSCDSSSTEVKRHFVSPSPFTPSLSCQADGTDPVTLQGVSHDYVVGNRTWIMSYVKFGNLLPRTDYTYSVKSGSSDCEWSDNFTFRSGFVLCLVLFVGIVVVKGGSSSLFACDERTDGGGGRGRTIEVSAVP